MIGNLLSSMAAIVGAAGTGVSRARDVRQEYARPPWLGSAAAEKTSRRCFLVGLWPKWLYDLRRSADRAARRTGASIWQSRGQLAGKPTSAAIAGAGPTRTPTPAAMSS